MKLVYNTKRTFARQVIITCISLFLSVASLSAQERQRQISFEEAYQLMNRDNKTLKIANKEMEWAKNEQQRLNSFWYPQVMATGAYMHMVNDIEVKEPLSQFTNPTTDFIHSIDPSEQFISSILNNLGKSSFSVPILPQNMTSIDAIVSMPVFTGGKRIYAGKIGKLMVDIAEINKEKISADQQILLVEAYYGLRLGQRIVEVKQETYNALEHHYQNALRLEANGMINKAERLFFQVNRDEAKRELEIAVKDLEIVKNTFKTLTKIESEDNILTTTPMFINESMPEIIYFKNLILEKNHLVNGLTTQQYIQKNEVKIAKSAYLPNIELFGKQTLYSNGIPKNIAPRTMVGVGFSWNIFDGLGREKRIKQAKIKSVILETEKEKIVDDITLTVDKFYNQTQSALVNVSALKTTMEMSMELVRSRQRAFIEGMASSSEVIDAELILSKVRIATLMAYYQFDSGLINLLAVCGIPETFHQYSLSGKDESYILLK